jgi:outer membrane receptor protein involved in Fe transport
MRGVANGGDGNHSTSLPSVGVYLDEQPVTTIQGALDIHMYDIRRIEALSGPQGTLYGASSEAGTLRIITNKPDPSRLRRRLRRRGQLGRHGGVGHVLEGFINAPLSTERGAARGGLAEARRRLHRQQARQPHLPDLGRGHRRQRHRGQSSLRQGRLQRRRHRRRPRRAALRPGRELDHHADVMGQNTEANGAFQYDPVVGDLALTHFRPEDSQDRWTQAALTVQGKIGNFDLSYNFAHLNRHDEVNSDYSDYAFWYDTIYGYGSYWYDDNGDVIDPTQYIQGEDKYRKTSHELRIASDADQRFRFVAGLFWQDQFHDIQQRYKIDDLSSDLEVTDWSDTSG